MGEQQVRGAVAVEVAGDNRARRAAAGVAGKGEPARAVACQHRDRVGPGRVHSDVGRAVERVVGRGDAVRVRTGGEVGLRGESARAVVVQQADRVVGLVGDDDVKVAVAFGVKRGAAARGRAGRVVDRPGETAAAVVGHHPDVFCEPQPSDSTRSMSPSASKSAPETSCPSTAGV